MAGFVSNIMSKTVDNDTYYLIPLQFDEGKIHVIVEDDLFVDHFTNDWTDQFEQIDLADKIKTMMLKCFPMLAADTNIVDYLHKQTFINYLMFSHNNLTQCLEYYLIGGEFDVSMVQPYSICSIESLAETESILIRKIQSGDWEKTPYYKIYNVCKPDTVQQKGVCYIMLNMILANPQYSEVPIFLYVDKSNDAALSCYTRNHFQKIVDVFTGAQLEHESIPNAIYMCYNKYSLQLAFQPNPFQLSPSLKTRFVLVAHGALAIPADAPFTGKFDPKAYEEDYYYPFENLQFYTQLGRVLSLEPEKEKNAVYDICYESVKAKETMVPNNKVVRIIPMFFSGFNKRTDPPGREKIMGLVNCNMKASVKTNVELFGENNDEPLELRTVLKYVYKYCVDNNINIDNVELKIFACRALCQVGDFALRGGDGESTEPAEGIPAESGEFVSSDKDSFYDFLIAQQTACEVPPTTGGKNNQKKSSNNRNKKTSRFFAKSIKRTLKRKISKL